MHTWLKSCPMNIKKCKKDGALMKKRHKKSSKRPNAHCPKKYAY